MKQGDADLSLNMKVLCLACIVRRWVHITMALLTLTDTLLTSRLSLRLGIPDKAFVLGASALGDALSQFRCAPSPCLDKAKALCLPFQASVSRCAATILLHSSAHLQAGPMLPAGVPEPEPLSLPCRFMPFLILSARLCPPGIEGTLFALFMSAYNFGNTLSGYMGATLASRLGITSSSFNNLTLAIAVQSFCTVLPIFLLAFVPTNVSGMPPF